VDRQLYAIEPNPKAYDILVANTYINSNLLFVSNECIWYKKENKDMYLPYGDAIGSGSSLVHGIGSTVQVDCITFDDFMYNKNLESIDFMKIDIEGAEFHVLFGIIKYFRIHKIKLPTLWLSAYPVWWSDEEIESFNTFEISIGEYNCYNENTNISYSYNDILYCIECNILCIPRY
jgi:FkbM family methyltransferase